MWSFFKYILGLWDNENDDRAGLGGRSILQLQCSQSGPRPPPSRSPSRPAPAAPYPPSPAAATQVAPHACSA